MVFNAFVNLIKNIKGKDNVSKEPKNTYTYQIIYISEFNNEKKTITFEYRLGHIKQMIITQTYSFTKKQYNIFKQIYTKNNDNDFNDGNFWVAINNSNGKFGYFFWEPTDKTKKKITF